MKIANNIRINIFLIFIAAIILTACGGKAGLTQDMHSEGELPTGNGIEGELIKLDGEEMFIQQPDGSEVVLHISDKTVFWEGITWMADIPVEIGDQIQAEGTWNSDLSVFEVKSYYANLQNLDGIVFYVCGESEAFMVDQPDQDYLILPLPNKTELLTETPEDPRSYKYFDLMPNFGEELQVVGRRIEDPFVIAVKVTRMD